MQSRIDESGLKARLSSFDASERRAALQELARNGEFWSPSKEEVNLHFHSFFSFNAESWSPSQIAWESLTRGLEVSGIVDFDVLDGMDEFHAAGDLLGLKTVVGMETRVYVPELWDKVTSSPNEPGIMYFMATGCYRQPEPGSKADQRLQAMRNIARARNVELVKRVNAYLDEVQIDYAADAIPLTPSGNATERHLLTAYESKAAKVFAGNVDTIASFWASKLGLAQQEAAALIGNRVKFHEAMRAKLMKFGGVGYVTPDSGSFPALDDTIEMIQDMDALPMMAWLDGTNDGEENSREWVGLLHSKGCAAINMIPDRSWNIKDPQDKAVKLRKLGEIVETAREFKLPMGVGTEMNRAGLPFADDFGAPEMRPFVKDFIEGARCLYGHTLLARHARRGYLGAWARETFGDDTGKKNEFYIKVGTGPAPSPETLKRLEDLSDSSGPDEVLRILAG